MAINPVQKKILIIGGLVLALMFLFPPWVYLYEREYTAPAFRPGDTGPVIRDQIERQAGYAPIFRAPSAYAALPALPQDADVNFVSVRVDATRLTVQAIGGIFLIAVLSIAVPRR